jgi:hypothetical protein
METNEDFLKRLDEGFLLMVYNIASFTCVKELPKKTCLIAIRHLYKSIDVY